MTFVNASHGNWGKDTDKTSERFIPFSLFALFAEIDATWQQVTSLH